MTIHPIINCISCSSKSLQTRFNTQSVAAEHTVVNKKKTCSRSFDCVRSVPSMEVNNDENISLVVSQRVITKLRGQTVIDSDFSVRRNRLSLPAKSDAQNSSKTLPLVPLFSLFVLTPFLKQNI